MGSLRSGVEQTSNRRPRNVIYSISKFHNQSRIATIEKGDRMDLSEEVKKIHKHSSSSIGVEFVDLSRGD